MGIVFFFSHQPAETLHLSLFPGQDKVCHLLAYAVLALSALWCFGTLGWGSFMRPARLAFLVCLAYGISDEFHQSFVPGREVSGLDLLADITGALLVCSVWLVSPGFRRGMQLLFTTLVGMLEKIYTKEG